MAIDLKRPVTAGLVGLLTSLSAQPVFSQAADDEMILDEIVVTAQKREENLQVVPVAVSVYTSEAIEERSLQNIAEVANFTPNIVRGSGPSSGDDAFFFFRGIGQLDNAGNVEPGVGVYVDEVYLGRVQGASIDVMDVNRIEVLRGPQGTLFGRNTIGGALNVTTRDPGDELGGKARVIGGDRSHIDVLGSIDVPIVDGLGLALSGFTRNQDGWADNVYTGDTYGDRQDVGGRAKLVWDASDTMEVKLTADWNDSQGTALPTVLLATNPFAFFPMGIPLPADMATEVDASPYDDNVSGSIDPDIDQQRGGAGLQFSWDLGHVQIKSITSYRKLEQNLWSDFDGSAYSMYDFNFDVDQDQWSQELQFSGSTDRLEWIAGVFYYNEDLMSRTIAGLGTNGPLLPPPPFSPSPPLASTALPATRLDGRALNFLSNFDQDTDSYAAFGQVKINITDALSTTLGLRYTKDEKDLNLSGVSDNTDMVYSPNCYLVPFPMCAPQGAIIPSPFIPISAKDDWDETSPKVGIEYQVTDDMMLYASWSNGFKSGGFQGRATPTMQAPAFEPETTEAWEAGMKSEFFDNHLRLNAAAFFTKYDDIQTLVLSPADGVFITSNAGDNEIKGVEFELIAALSDGFDVSLAGGWMDTEWQSLDPSAALYGLTMDDDLAFAPELTAAVGVQYSFEIGSLGGMALRADYNWRDDFSFQAANNPGDLQDAYGLLDLRATWFSPEERFTVAAYVRNATDEEYFSNLNDQRGQLGVSTGTPAQPRDYGVEFGYSFGE
jgi:iron complex outermembrane recepter protein